MKLLSELTKEKKAELLKNLEEIVSISIGINNGGSIIENLKRIISLSKNIREYNFMMYLKDLIINDIHK